MKVAGGAEEQQHSRSQRKEDGNDKERVQPQP